MDAKNATCVRLMSLLLSNLLYRDFTVLAVLRHVLSHVLVTSECSAEALSKLDVEDAALCKARPKLGSDTKKAIIESWDTGEKRAFCLGAHAPYLACSKCLLLKLPLANKIIMHAKLLALKCCHE